MKITDARKIVFQKRPDFKLLCENYGNKYWSDYIKNCYPKKNLLDLKPELLKTIQTILNPLIGKNKTKKTLETLKKTGFVSTAEHMGILCHPYFINGNLARSNNKKESIISFPCGGISLSNKSFPRGISFHDSNLDSQKFYLVSLKYKQRPIFGFSSIKKSMIQNILNNIKILNIPKDKKEKLVILFEKIINNKKIWKQKMYSDQLTMLNDFFWEETFKSSRGNLVHIECETLIRNLLINIHLKKRTIINKLIFNKITRDKYIKNNENIIGAHNSKKETGSHLFWYIDQKKNKRIQLFIKNQKLISQDKTIAISITPSNIKKLLESYTLMPTMALCYGILSSYYGLTLGGGFWQIKYLGDITEAWQQTFNTENLKIKNSETNIMTADFFVTGIHNKKKSVFSGILDIYLWSNDSENTNRRIEKAFKEVTVNNSFNPMMNEFAESVTGKKINITNSPIPHNTFQI